MYMQGSCSGLYAKPWACGRWFEHAGGSAFTRLFNCLWRFRAGSCSTCDFELTPIRPPRMLARTHGLLVWGSFWKLCAERGRESDSQRAKEREETRGREREREIVKERKRQKRREGEGERGRERQGGRGTERDKEHKPFVVVLTTIHACFHNE